MKKDIRDLTLDELEKEVASLGEPAHRARQIFLWLNGKSAADFGAMTDLSRKFISKLEKKFYVGELVPDEHLVAMDGTEKFLWRLEDGELIESVLIKEAKRRTTCLSTQVGCRFKCPFCASGKKGFVRNLRVSEILGQLLSVQKECGQRITNVVFMGMGEPLDNYDNLMKAIRVINHPGGIGIGARKITISTCGIVPGIRKLINEKIQVELSVSLHAANDRLRNELVPVNRKYSLENLIPACKEYFEKTGRIITLEYTLIAGKNDSLQDARELATMAKSVKAKVNLIVCNPISEAEGTRIDKKQLAAFKNLLKAKKVTVTVRKSRGDEIMASCGQLAAMRGTGFSENRRQKTEDREQT